MGELIVPDSEPRVVCASCGRSRDKLPNADTCEAPDWHQPHDYGPGVDVTAEDGDELAPATEEDLLAAVGPEPGKTWAELYARAALQLSYRSAELAGAQRELDRLRQQPVPVHLEADQAAVVAALVWRARGDSTELRLPITELTERRRLRSWVDPATGDLVLVAEVAP